MIASRTAVQHPAPRISPDRKLQGGGNGYTDNCHQDMINVIVDDDIRSDLRVSKYCAPYVAGSETSRHDPEGRSIDDLSNHSHSSSTHNTEGKGMKSGQH